MRISDWSSDVCSSDLPREHPKADADRDDRIDPGHTGEANGYRPADEPDRAEHVSPDFEICAFEIEAPLLAGRQNAHRHQIDDQTGYRNYEHAPRLHRIGTAAAVDCYPQHIKPNVQQT